MSAADPTSPLTAALEDRYRIGSALGEGSLAPIYIVDDLRQARESAHNVPRDS